MIQKLSVVSPVYDAKEILNTLVTRIENSVKNLCNIYEIILVNDGCPKDSWSVLEQIANQNKNVKAINLSRNFGQHHAITAGLSFAEGDWVVVMDCDLQDKPEEIENLLKKALEGYDIVLARRSNRQDNFLKRIFSKTFYRSLGYLTGSEQDETVANFGIYSQKVIQNINQLKESIRYFPTMIKWIGFKVAKIDVEHAAREHGKSSYNFSKMMNLALNIILAYSDKPLRILIKIGFLISMIATLMSIYTFILWYNGGVEVIGYASIITSVWLLSGFLIMTLGIVGLYVGKTFEGVKNRPIFIIDKTINA